MVRIAVATTVWSRAARNMAIIRPMRIVRIWRWGQASGGVQAATGSATGSTARAAAGLVRVRPRRGAHTAFLCPGRVRSGQRPGH